MTRSNKIIDTLRATFISFELAALLAVCLVFPFISAIVDRAASATLRADLGAVLTLLGIPLALAIASYSLVKEILYPTAEYRKVLVAWPGYWRLRMRCIVGLIWAAGGVVGAWTGILMLHLDQKRSGVFVIAATFAASLVSLISLIAARFAGPDILDNPGA